MAGAKVAPGKTEQEVPPHEAGKEVLSYVQREEAEADAIFNEVHGIDQEEEGTGEGEKAAEEGEKKTESQEPEKADDKEAADKEPESKGKEALPEDLIKGLSTENANRRISAAQTKMIESNTRANTAEGQVDKLTEERDTLLKKLEEKGTAPAATITEKADEVKKVEEPKDDELQASLDELALEYPEIAKPMLKMMARQEVENKRLTEKVTLLEEKEETRTADAKTEKQNDHITAISNAHPDFETISNEPLLDTWIDSLPAVEKAGAQAIRKSGTTTDVIDLLTMFKKANGYEIPADSKEESPAKKSNSKLDKAKKAANPSFNKSKDVNIQDGQAVFTRQQIDAMSPQEFAENEPAIDAAMAKGLVS